MGHGPRGPLDKPPVFHLYCDLETTPEEDALTIELLTAAVRRDWKKACDILNTEAGDNLLLRRILRVHAHMTAEILDEHGNHEATLEIPPENQSFVAPA